LQKDVTFSSDFFFSLLLPPIVFSVGYSINRSFFQHLLAIVFFGIISTLLAVSMQGGLLALFNSILFDNSLTGKDLLLVTIITCSSDPITALSLLKVSLNASSPTRTASTPSSEAKAY
jgi:NhaP-type Na+/H+ or K+/H+ antiporter